MTLAGGCGSRPLGDPDLPAQLVEDPLDDPAFLPLPEPAVDGLPGREVDRQLPPGTPGPVDVQAP
jgi:hypothetical protein